LQTSGSPGSLRAVRRLLPVLVGTLVVIGGLFALLVLFHGRDDAGLGGGGAGTDQAGPGTFEPAGTSRTPPSSGPHERRNVTSERRVSRDALLTALELGDVVLVHPPGRTPPQLRKLQRDVAGGPFDPELAAAGQMVVVAPWPGVEGVQALAYRRRLRASGPDDPQLRAFAEAWLGKGRGMKG
jgi:hypothetical protein